MDITKLLREVSQMQRLDVDPNIIIEKMKGELESEQFNAEQEQELKWERLCEDAMYERTVYTDSDRDARNYTHFLDGDATLCPVCENFDTQCSCDECDCFMPWHMCECPDKATKHLHRFN